MAETEPGGRGRPSNESFHGELLSSLFYPFYLCSQACYKEKDREGEEERPQTVHIPHVADVSERIRRVCKDLNIRGAFTCKSGLTFCSLLIKVKDLLPLEKQVTVVYEISCTCRNLKGVHR